MSEVKVVSLERARARLGERGEVRDAYFEWRDRIMREAPALVKTLARLTADRIEARIPGEIDEDHPWVPLLLGRYGGTLLFEELGLSAPDLLAPMLEGDFEVWRVVDDSTFDFTVRRIRRARDRAFTLPKTTLAPWFEPRQEDLFVGVLGGTKRLPEWYGPTRIDEAIGEALEFAVDLGDYGSGPPYEEDFLVLSSEDRVVLRGLEARRYRSEDHFYDRYSMRPSDQAEVAHSILATIARLQAGKVWFDELEGSMSIFGLIVIDEPVNEAGETGLELARAWIEESWEVFWDEDHHVDEVRAPVGEILEAFGFTGDGALPDHVTRPTDTNGRLLARFCRAFGLAQVALRETTPKRARFGREFDLLQFGMSLAPDRFDRPLRDLPLRQVVRDRLIEGLGERRIWDPELESWEFLRIRGIGEKSLEQILDAYVAVLLRACRTEAT